MTTIILPDLLPKADIPQLMRNAKYLSSCEVNTNLTKRSLDGFNIKWHILNVRKKQWEMLKWEVCSLETARASINNKLMHSLSRTPNAKKHTANLTCSKKANKQTFDHAKLFSYSKRLGVV